MRRTEEFEEYVQEKLKILSSDNKESLQQPSTVPKHSFSSYKNDVLSRYPYI